jgi:hypothetical protein
MIIFLLIFATVSFLGTIGEKNTKSQMYLAILSAISLISAVILKLL